MGEVQECSDLRAARLAKAVAVFAYVLAAIATLLAMCGCVACGLGELRLDTGPLPFVAAIGVGCTALASAEDWLRKSAKALVVSEKSMLLAKPRADAHEEALQIGENCRMPEKSGSKKRL